MTKDPVLGHCKTRLAQSLGDEKALEIYIQLLDYTAEITEKVEAERFIFSTSKLNDKSRWENPKTQFQIQSQGDLGTRMHNAIRHVFDLGFEKAIVIGSDCAEMNAQDIEKAFNELESKDIVIGPAIDGGYYLIGMKKLTPSLFQNIEWSTASVCKDTISKVKKLNLSFARLPEKSDIDYEEDLKREGYVRFNVEISN